MYDIKIREGSFWFKDITVTFSILFYCFLPDLERECQVIWCLMKSNTVMRANLIANSVRDSC